MASVRQDLLRKLPGQNLYSFCPPTLTGLILKIEPGKEQCSAIFDRVVTQ